MWNLKSQLYFWILIMRWDFFLFYAFNVMFLTIFSSLFKAEKNPGHGIVSCTTSNIRNVLGRLTVINWSVKLHRYNYIINLVYNIWRIFFADLDIALCVYMQVCLLSRFCPVALLCLLWMHWGTHEQTDYISNMCLQSKWWTAHQLCHYVCGRNKQTTTKWWSYMCWTHTPI